MDIGTMRMQLSVTPKWRWLRRMHLRQDIDNLSLLLMGECNG